MAFGGDRGHELRESVSLGIPRNEEQLLTILEMIGVEIESYDEEIVRVLCPFHGNHNTSAMAVSNPEGLFFCHNPMCGESGNLLDLVRGVKRCDFFTAVRLIDNANSGGSLSVTLKSKSEKPSLVVPEEMVERWHNDLLHDSTAMDYLHGRGFSDETIKEFQLGYSRPQGMLITPLRDAEGSCVGGIGRSVVGKVFKNIPGTKTSKTLFNINNAKRYHTAIIVESNFDALRVHQAGFPNVVATCGGNFSEEHVQQVAYYFERVIIMTDDDGFSIPPHCKSCKDKGLKYCVGHNAGREFGATIADKCLRAGVTPRWASYDGCGIIYPDKVKDAGDMTDEQITQTIKNNVSNFEYNTWKKENI